MSELTAVTAEFDKLGAAYEAALIERDRAESLYAQTTAEVTRLQAELESARSGEPWVELARLQSAIQGPDGYATWQDAATAERIKRVQLQAESASVRQDARRYQLLRGNFAARDVSDALGVPWIDLRADESLISKIDTLCDAAIEQAKEDHG